MEITRVTVKQVQSRRERGEDVVFLDARNPTDWENSGKKLPGALRARADEEVERVFRRVPKDAAVVAYCT